MSDHVAPTFTADDTAFLRRWVEAWDDVCDLAGADKGAVAFSGKELATRIERQIESQRAAARHLRSFGLLGLVESHAENSDCPICLAFLAQIESSSSTPQP